MRESRSLPRLNVNWRGAIMIAPGHIIPLKIVNYSPSGVQVQCNVVLKEQQRYQMMMEVPSKRDASERVQVVGKATCVYTILSGGEYRAGMQQLEIPPEHKALLDAWRE